MRKAEIGEAGSVFQEAALNLVGVKSATAGWADIDNDGNLDLLYSGEPETFDQVLLLY